MSKYFSLRMPGTPFGCFVAQARPIRRAGDPATSTLETMDVVRLGADPSGTGARHDKLDDNQRKEAAQFYGEQAMKLLRDAVSKGWKNVAHMKTDTDLDPLRQREDYKKLIAEHEGKGKQAAPKASPR